MKFCQVVRLSFIFLILSCSICVYADSISVIPKPEILLGVDSQFDVDLSEVDQIIISRDQASVKAAKMLQQILCPVMDKELPVVTKLMDSNVKAIELKIVKGNEFGHEGYRFSTTNGRLAITANDGAGLFYGIQTLRQLLPMEIEKKQLVSAEKLKLPPIIITDKPRYGWRGLMLDESREFFGKDTVKKLLDRMALYKMNRFHWHLTDSPGWRVEIKQYPKLTEIGGIGTLADPEAKAQYYTQADIKEIVAYAAARHIIVIPEIDMPGHATAANRAYPEYSGGGSKKHPEF
ncbi:MAG: beta-N-acetylhexosaminidase, partial [Anaerohalosphaera sp.]|nr:beta-N-acetylhexosaminidase [Anaerohalosphaera sp.]